MPTLERATAQGRRIDRHRPWPRVVVDDSLWQALASRLSDGRCSLLGLWGETAAVHMALYDEKDKSVLVASRECPNGRFASVARFHPPALRLERALRDLCGLSPVGLTDDRAWL